MKHIGKLVALGAVLTASVSSAHAAGFNIGSYANFTCPGTANCVTPATVPGGDINTPMSFLGFVAQNFGNGPTFIDPGFQPPSAPGNPQPTYTLIPGSTWAPGNLPNSTWVGYAANSGPQPGTANNPAQGFYTFSTSFVDSGIFSGTLNVYADDSVEVFLNGTALVNELIGFGTLGSDLHCADGQPNCVTQTSSAFTTVNGTNTLTFVVVQAGNELSGDPSGIDFNASVAPTPEPSSLMLLGTGLVGAAGMFFRRRVTV